MHIYLLLLSGAIKRQLENASNYPIGVMYSTEKHFFVNEPESDLFQFTV